MKSKDIKFGKPEHLKFQGKFHSKEQSNNSQSVNFAGQNHLWQLSGLLCIGTSNIYNYFTRLLAIAISQIIIQVCFFLISSNSRFRSDCGKTIHWDYEMELLASLCSFISFLFFSLDFLFVGENFHHH